MAHLSFFSLHPHFCRIIKAIWNQSIINKIITYINKTSTTITENADLRQSLEFVSAVSECSDSVNIERVFSLTNHWLPFFLACYMNFFVRLLAVVYLNINITHRQLYFLHINRLQQENTNVLLTHKYVIYWQLVTCKSFLLVACLLFSHELMKSSLRAARHRRRKLLIFQLLLDSIVFTLCCRHFTM